MTPEGDVTISRRGDGLIQLWQWAGDNQKMTKSTAQQHALASRKILETLGDPAAIDVLSLDVDEAVRRFRNNSRELKESTKDTYEMVFRRGVESFKEYIGDPISWQPPTPRSRTRNPGQAVSRQKAVASSADPPSEEIPVALPHAHGNRMAKVIVPHDLRSDEIDLLVRVIPAYLEARRGG